LLRNHEHIQQ
jgi:hypothetical protein